jgi:hypothetical protein
VQQTASLVWDQNKVNPISLEMSVSPASKLPIVVAVGVNFDQAVNNKMYTLNSGTFNAAAITEVSPAPAGG